MELVTERLRLREFVEQDWPAVFAYQSDPFYLRYYRWITRREEDVKQFVQMFLDWQLEWPRYKFQFAIVLLATDKLIGCCGIRKRTADAPKADIGYEIDPHYWRQGYATEAACALLQFGFESLKLHRIWANCVADNAGSARVLEKVGMQLEGQLRQNQWMKNRWWDTLLYGILADEWQAQKQHCLEWGLKEG